MNGILRGVTISVPLLLPWVANAVWHPQPFTLGGLLLLGVCASVLIALKFNRVPR